jgi:outer membrane protein assembly factor BamB
MNTGEALWRASLGSSLQSTPIVTEEAVYLATFPGVLYALR